jgi:hypothetical protein
MKKLDCRKSVGRIKDGAQGIPLGAKTGVAVSGLLIASLLAVGCSQKQSKPAGIETQTSTNQMALNPPITPKVTDSASTATATPEPKKIAKKKPSAVVGYSDPTYGVSFRYPRKYALKSGGNIDLAAAPMDFVRPGGVPAVSVELPKGVYPDTDLASAFFRVNVNKSLTETECAQFALPLPLGSDKAPLEPSKVGMGTLEMQEAETISSEETKQVDTKYYHLFQNGSCYEFALGLSTESGVKDDGTRTVDREKVFQRLATILATVKIKPEATPQVAAGSTTTPSAHEEGVK